MIELLARLEGYRQKLKVGIYQPGTNNHSIRMCQAHVAEAAGYTNRVAWIDDLKCKGLLNERGQHREAID